MKKNSNSSAVHANYVDKVDLDEKKIVTKSKNKVDVSTISPWTS